TLPLGDTDWQAAQALVGRRYGTWAWNYGENPPCNLQRARRFPAGEIDVRLNIQKGSIDSVRLFGDYMGRSDIGELEARLMGLAYNRDALASVLGSLEMSEYFGDISREEVLALLAP
ncbi:MAG: lipoate protein ligase C-terminal domain-containing protein, partial [Gemmatimonadales bacterium]